MFALTSRLILSLWSRVKNYLFVFIFIGVALYSGSILLEKFTNFDWFKSEGDTPVLTIYQGPTHSYPGDEVLRNIDGNQLDVTLIGRDSDNVEFIRKGDGKRFVYAISKLDAKSQELLSLYPIIGITNSASGSTDSLRLINIRNLETEVQTIDDQLSRLKLKIQSTVSTVEARTLTNKYNDLVGRRADLLDKLADYR